MIYRTPEHFVTLKWNENRFCDLIRVKGFASPRIRVVKPKTSALKSSRELPVKSEFTGASPVEESSASAAFPLTLTDSWPAYLTLTRGSWTTSRLVPVTVSVVCPLFAGKEQALSLEPEDDPQ